MVKVKVVVEPVCLQDIPGFNHPMVKVKVKNNIRDMPVDKGFNHPMVKVKDLEKLILSIDKMFQPPYGES